MAKWTLQNGFAPLIGTGLTEWDQVHVHDLSDLFVKLVDATADLKLREDPEIFGEKGYHFCEAGAHTWGEVAKCEYFYASSSSPKKTPPEITFTFGVNKIHRRIRNCSLQNY